MDVNGTHTGELNISSGCGFGLEATNFVIGLVQNRAGQGAGGQQTCGDHGFVLTDGTVQGGEADGARPHSTQCQITRILGDSDGSAHVDGAASLHEAAIDG